MASNIISREAKLQDIPVSRRKESSDDSSHVWHDIKRTFIRPLASLKITVTLFALSIFLILAGTMAQAEKNMWEVMGQYFYPYVAWIDVRVFFARSFFPDWPDGWYDMRETPFAFPFPGGASIGLMMIINLTAAFLTKFNIQARGKRLAAGLGVSAFGALITFLVIASGHSTDGVQDELAFSLDTLWLMMKVGLVMLWIAGGTALWFLNENQRVEKWLLIGVEAVLAAVICFLLFQGESAQLSGSSMRILWQLLQAGFAGVVLLIGYMLLFKRRGGVVLIHTAVGLLMFGQWMVSQYDVESRMRIEEGQTINYTRDIRSTELAIVDESDPEQNHVMAIPLSVSGRPSQFLTEETPIVSDKLPFDVEIIKYFKSAELRKVESEESTPVDAGESVGYVAESARASSGADVSGRVDLAAAYVRFRDKESGEPLGTYLLTQALSEQGIYDHVEAVDPATGEAKRYEVALRFRRDYKPYSLHLIDVRKDDYMGTRTPRNYSSRVRLVDHSRGEDREPKIWMNNPLRFAGETFYQSGYDMDKRLGLEVTDLQVVKNHGWMIPYVSCMLAMVGMMAHFLMTLIKFIEKSARESSRTGAAQAAAIRAGVSPEGDYVIPKMADEKSEKRGKSRGTTAPVPAGLDARSWPPASLQSDNNTVLFASIALSVLVLLTFGGFLARRAAPPKYAGNEMRLYEAGKLPVMYQGRLKPLDTLARNTMRIVTNNRETFVDNNGDRQPAIHWLLDTISGAEEARHHKVFYIHHEDVLNTLGLERRKSHLYSVAELAPKMDDFSQQVAAAHKLPAEQLEDYQRQLLVLERRIREYIKVSRAFQPLPFPPMPTEEDFERDREETAAKIMQIRQLMQAAPEEEKEILAMEPPLIVPPQGTQGDWAPYGPAWNRAYLQQELMQQEANPATLALTRIFAAYKSGNGREFNDLVERYAAQLKRDNPSELGDKQIRQASFEAFFNNFRPFLWSYWLYLAAFVMVLASWMISIGSYRWGRPVNWAAFSLIGLLFVVHTLAIVARIYISGRPPVTNLYSSAVFIGWGAVVFGLVFEVFFRLGVGNLIAAIAGFSTLQIADGLAGDGDTFTVLQAVLDTQFWLSTHVVIISLGYVATFVAGFIGLCFAIGGMTAPLSSHVRRTLYWMIYGTVCFGIFFSFVGTVLGGLWADDSWGRFWGWDPKENGALIIVIWNALMLHARWDGMVKERGFALLAIGGNIVTAWSWFGVNELGIGLHSYGFTDGVLMRLGVFALSQLAVIAVGMALPKRLWRSYAAEAEATG